MKVLTANISRNMILRDALIDLFAIAFVVFTPAMSHMLSLPLYLMEPMRIMVALALVHTRRNNAYLLALVLPLASYLVSGHPHILKMGLIMIELSINVYLFFLIRKHSRSAALALFSSIILSKSVYYLLKYILILTVLPDTELIATPLWMQLLVALSLSSYMFFTCRSALHEKS